jgi:hypothetical protein
MKQITTDELRAMTNREGIVIQGCGGDLSEWVTGINDILTQEGILQNGDSFKEVFTFEHDGCTNLLFSMENVDLHIGKLAMWRLQSHSSFGGTWLSDYLPNRLGVNMDETPAKKEKPDCALIEQDGNIFSLMGIASRTLKNCGLGEQAKEMRERITASGRYEEALGIIGEYVNITSTEDALEQDSGFEMGQRY